ncbi:MAG: carboxypeptidase regulatory-like domain-containing protein [Gemmatimonadaceae bacterium]|nr:carboxypeptidase regulatory-like domain-containing protein [Gemmatimonadaceae bacterium]
MAPLLVAASVLVLGAGALGAQQRTPPRKAPAKPPVVAPKAGGEKGDSAAAPKVEASPAPKIAIASITGTVFDSLHGVPLSAATVSIEGTDRLAITTERGVFRIDSIPPGTHRLKVDHIVLDSLGIAMITAPFELKDGSAEMMTLSIPSSQTLVEVSCPAARRNLGPGAVIGRLLDADDDHPVEGARVSVAWLEMSLNAGLRKIPRVREALSGADGVFRICGLPANFEGTLQAILKGVTTSEVRVKAEGTPLVVQGLRIGNANTVVAANDSLALKRQKEAATGPTFSAARLHTGNAVLNGRVTNAAGAAVVGARVDVIGTPGATLTKENGEFSIANLPSGTQSVVVRQIGFAPEERAVDLSTRAPTRLEVKMTRAAQVMNTIVVKADREVGLEKVGFSTRKKVGGGYFLDGDEILKRAPNMLTDVFRSIPGLRVVPSGNGMDYTVESARAVTGSCVKYWVDGAPFEAVFPGDVDRILPPNEIAAIEVYNGVSVPAQFQAPGQSSCAAVVLWSKTRVDRPLGKK